MAVLGHLGGVRGHNARMGNCHCSDTDGRSVVWQVFLTGVSSFGLHGPLSYGHALGITIFPTRSVILQHAAKSVGHLLFHGLYLSQRLVDYPHRCPFAILPTSRPVTT